MKLKNVFNRILNLLSNPRATLPAKTLDLYYLVFPVTYSCNLRCEMCTCPEQAKEVGIMSIDQIRNLLEGLDNQSRNNKKIVNLTGGEIFLRNDLVDIVDLLQKNNYTRINISSNFFNKRKTIDNFKSLLERFPKIDWAIQTSIDGLKQVHNQVRGNAKSFDNSIETLREIYRLKQKYKFHLSINFTISEKNINDVKIFEKRFRSEVSEEVPVFYTYSVNSDLYINSLNSRVKGQFSKANYFEKLKSLSLWLYYKRNDLFSLDVYLMLNGNKRFSQCSFYHGGYFVEPNGKLYKCSVDSRSYLGDPLKSNFDIEREAQNKLKLIKDSCNTCFNNCGNGIYSSGIFDFLKSNYFSDIHNVYLETSKFDILTGFFLNNLGIRFRYYKGESLGENDIILTTKQICPESVDYLKYVKIPIFLFR